MAAGSATAVAAALMLSACAGSPDEGGFGLPTLTSVEAEKALGVGPGRVPSEEGVLVVRDNGCFTLSRSGGDSVWIIWPERTRLDADDAARVILSDGSTAGDGDDLVIEGSPVPLDALPGGEDPDSYFGSFGRFCGADAAGALVALDVVAR